MLIVVALITLFVMPLLAAEETAVPGNEKEDAPTMGKDLVETVWKYMKQGDIDQLKTIMADDFQSLHQDGSRDKNEELELISGLDLGEYKLTDFVVTRNGNTLVVTYFVSVEETIEGERMDSKPAPRMSTFVKLGEDWKWVAHANLKTAK